MKKFYAPLACLILLSSCLAYKELPVEYDYSYNGTFKRYRTFDVMRHVGAANDSSMTNSIIEKSILSRMKFLGYKQTQNRPHLIISFKMFPDSLKFRGYDQPDIESWILTEKENLKYHKKQVDLTTGTLLIQLFDRKQNRTIWQGYSTSLYGDIDFHDNRNLRNAVISILDKYRFWAAGFIENAALKPSEINN
jgi:Domain of unknown function (DUF4136)